MCTNIYKTDILAGSLLGSFYICSFALLGINNIYSNAYAKDVNIANKILAINGVVAFFSTFTIGYIAHKTITL